MKNQLKYLQKLFYDLLNDYGKVYLVVKHSERSIIGKRGFTEDEKKNGLVLVFTRNNYRNLHWSEDGCLHAQLGFGAVNRPEPCVLHADDIVAVFSPDARVKYERWDMWAGETPAARPDTTQSNGVTNMGGEIRGDEKIVSIDVFRKKKR